ncbi:beta-ketoacyl-[acyl-carrier-protein] synthase family protein [Bythopirellula goksoeyrii]|uniref:3-oxoacyl-[acyl-carrier-protein] synthase 2 n=1 Tax=Bythopirellula goksoeyrii TaxID=1400387 RepID=A0A5B9Q3I8_9BACT|nr:beta-ketoacyl-[acyl-carrier-protein] synthase family protein [Bythopirellula goksoeyrii]QEG33564.1 3-oxoacyl-[acyl-carrier-protein] synthase 2 [Bythopirellula goksoeyrii]
MQEVVITGMGIVCPLGIGSEAVWSAIENRESGIRTVPRLVEAGFPITIGGEVPDFDGKQYVKPRKSLKVMCRETQLAFTAAELAWADAKLDEAKIDSERLGVVLGSSVFRSELPDLTALYQEASNNGKFDFTRWDSAIKQLYPLWMLKYLPNMASCHVGIAKDARGPNNTIVEGDVSSLLAIIEAADTIARGHADVMLTGATGSLLAWVDVCWHGGARMTRNDNPDAASRPFDSARDGFVMSEGSAVLVLESLAHAEQRGAKILGRILGYGRRAEAVPRGKLPTGQSIRQSIRAALEMGHVSPDEVGHVNAHGLSTIEDDAIEAEAIQAELKDVSVTAPKSFVGNSGASGGAIELAISLLGLQKNLIPPTLNCDDPTAGLNVACSAQLPKSATMLALNHKLTGQAVSLLVGGA